MRSGGWHVSLLANWRAALGLKCDQRMIPQRLLGVRLFGCLQIYFDSLYLLLHLVMLYLLISYFSIYNSSILSPVAPLFLQLLLSTFSIDYSSTPLSLTLLLLYLLCSCSSVSSSSPFVVLSQSFFLLRLLLSVLWSFGLWCEEPIGRKLPT